MHVGILPRCQRRRSRSAAEGQGHWSVQRPVCRRCDRV